MLRVPDGLRVDRGGAGAQQLLLLHGLGATAEVWRPLIPSLEETWPGRWIAPDLPGHGSSDPLWRYSFGAFAAQVALTVDPGEPVVVVGHSLGGVVALALASGWFGVEVEAVIGIGIKVAWTPEELAKAQSLAARPVTWFESYDEAAKRHLLVSGLQGLVELDDPAVTSGVREEGGRWRLALDPRAFGVGAPDLAGLLAAARADVVLARGEHDAMVTAEQLDAVRPGSLTLAAVGHNAHIEQPEVVAELLRRIVVVGRS